MFIFADSNHSHNVLSVLDGEKERKRLPVVRKGLDIPKQIVEQHEEKQEKGVKMHEFIRGACSSS